MAVGADGTSVGEKEKDVRTQESTYQDVRSMCHILLKQSTIGKDVIIYINMLKHTITLQLCIIGR